MSDRRIHKTKHKSCYTESRTRVIDISVPFTLAYVQSDSIWWPMVKSEYARWRLDEFAQALNMICHSKSSYGQRYHHISRLSHKIRLVYLSGAPVLRAHACIMCALPSPIITIPTHICAHDALYSDTHSSNQTYF